MGIGNKIRGSINIIFLKGMQGKACAPAPTTRTGSAEVKKAGLTCQSQPRYAEPSGFATSQWPAISLQYGPAAAQTTYDEGNVGAVRQVVSTYGAEGETLSASGSTEPVRYAYDALYRLKTLTDGGGHTTSYFYNPAGDTAQVVYPGASSTPPAAPLAAGSYDTTTYPSYDADGNLLSRVDGNNVTTSYTYNTPESLLSDITYPAGSIGSVHLSYDPYGRRAGMTDGTGSQTYTYDDDSILASKTVTYTGLPGKTINYSYYPNGSRQGMSITGDANSFSYSYDAVGRLAGLTAPSTDSATWTYLDNGWLQSQSLTSAVAITTKANYSYNACGLLTNSNFGYGGTSFLYQYTNMTYDGAENRTSSGMILSGSTSSAQTTYVYDNKNQLLQEQSQRGMGYVNNFAYDGSNNGSGNATTFRGGAQAFNQDNQLLGADIGYDGAGNPTLYKGNALSFDPENRLTAYGSALTVAYNDDGLRAWKQNSTSRTYFLYDGHQPILTMTATGTTIKENLFGPNGLVGSGSPAGFSSYGFDPQGNTARMIRPNGSQSNGGTFDAFGKNLSTTGSPGEYVGFGAQWGGYTDSETGLVLFTHRFYDPATGRFLTRDPMGYGGGINLYGYCGNDPINEDDPDGTAPVTMPTAPWDPITPTEPFPVPKPPPGAWPILGPVGIGIFLLLCAKPLGQTRCFFSHEVKQFGKTYCVYECHDYDTGQTWQRIVPKGWGKCGKLLTSDPKPNGPRPPMPGPIPPER